MGVDSITLFFDKGGFTSYLIAFAGLSLVIIGLERLNYLYFRLRPLTSQMMSQLQLLIQSRKYMEAIQICNDIKNVPQIQVIKAGLLAVDSGREAMKSSLGSAVVEVVKECEKRVSFISLIASVATLLGLLGTISGLIKTFSAISSADPAKKAELLGLGISEAMVATAAGLIVGITAMVVYTLCASKTEDHISLAKKAGYDLVTTIERSEREA
ncbi:MAG: MotA/TolQ/ExbB proton channel family protein [Bdellovibrionales bacterium]